MKIHATSNSHRNNNISFGLKLKDEETREFMLKALLEARGGINYKGKETEEEKTALRCMRFLSTIDAKDTDDASIQVTPSGDVFINKGKNTVQIDLRDKNGLEHMTTLGNLKKLMNICDFFAPYKDTLEKYGLKWSTEKCESANKAKTVDTIFE